MPFNNRKSYILIFALILALASGLYGTSPVLAASIIVNSNADNTLANLDANTTCDLREAIANANDDAVTYSDCPAGFGVDTITFAANYIITISGDQLPAVITTITINGNGATNTILQANANPNIATYRIFQVDSGGNLTLDSLTVRNGRCTDFCNGAVNAGGGIYNKGILSVTNSAFSGNSASFGGGIYSDFDSTLTITHSTFSGNSASFGGVIQNRGTLTIMESIFFGNSAAHGGSIHNNGPMTVTNSTFSGNAATGGGGGGITNNYNSRTVVVMNSMFSNNTALHGGGIDSVGNLTMANSTFSGNSTSSGNGGGIDLINGTLAVTNTTFLSNSVNSNYSGGGIYAKNSDVSISQSTFQSNSALNDGGGIYLYNSTTTISRSTFSGNAVTGVSSSDGGAIVNYAIFGTGTLTIENSTFSENNANAGHGGAIHNIAAGTSAAYAATTELINSTIVENNAQAGHYGGGVYASTESGSETSSMTLSNSIIYGNTISTGTGGKNCASANNAIIVTNNNNLFENLLSDCVAGVTDISDSGSLSTIVNTLANNGGPTLTHALPPNSPAVNKGNDANCPSTDQRGVTRPKGTHCDIGAFEYDPNAAAVQVNIAGNNVGNYIVASNSSTRSSYAGLDGGPVKVMSTNGIPIVVSERVAYNNGSAWTSYSELMGLPANQLTTSYTFPWYNNLDLNSQLRFGNVGTANTTVTVTVGGVFKGSYNLAPNASQRISYVGLDAGPVKVTSSGGVPIIASERVAYFNGSAWTSFSEIMGLPSPKLTHSYVFPWYNNLDLNSQLRFGNVGTSPTTVTVTVGGVFKGSYQLAPNESKRVSYLGLDGGPVKVTSSGSVPIIASLRVAYHNGSAWTDFSEMMGLPIGSLSTRYSFPVYNNVNLNTQLRFANVGNATTTVTVTIGGVLKGSYMLAPNESKRVNYAGLDNGPVVIQSSGNIPIIASERVAYFDGSAWTSFAEMMGLPQSQLSTSYVFPWYNNLDINSQLRFGVP